MNLVNGLARRKSVCCSVRSSGHECPLGPVNTTTEKLENAALFLFVRPAFHSNRSWRRSVWKTLFKQEEFENAGAALRFSVDRKHLEKGAFRNGFVTITLWFPCPKFTSTTNPTWLVTVAFSNISSVVWRKTFMVRFQRENAIFNLFFRRIVERATH